MSRYSVYRFIEDDLQMTPYTFAKTVKMPLSTLSNYMQRNRTVESLPIGFLMKINQISDSGYQSIIDKLMQYQSENTND